MELLLICVLVKVKQVLRSMHLLMSAISPAAAGLIDEAVKVSSRGIPARNAARNTAINTCTVRGHRYGIMRGECGDEQLTYIKPARAANAWRER